MRNEANYARLDRLPNCRRLSADENGFPRRLTAFGSPPIGSLSARKNYIIEICFHVIISLEYVSLSNKIVRVCSRVNVHIFLSNF